MVTTVTMVLPVIKQDWRGIFRCAKRGASSSSWSGRVWWGLVFLPLSTMAADWDASARLGLSETYSDNINLSVDQEQYESITEIIPGFSLAAQGGRLNLGLDYAMQNIFYARDSSRNKTSHKLNAHEHAEVVQDLFYFDSRASISQQLVSFTDQLSVDNLNPVGDRDDVWTLQLEPYLKRNLGSYVSAELRYSHGWVEYDRGNASDSESSVTSGYLANGHGATYLNWRVGYRLQKDMRESGVDSERRSTNGMIRFRVLSSLSLVGYAGREENDIQTSRSSTDGTYWSAGFAWTPSPKFMLEGTTGENFDQGHLSWKPISRTSVDISYSDKDVGLNTSSTWSGRISHRTRRSTWAFDYSEAVTNVQVLTLTGLRPVFVTDDQGEIVYDPDTGLPLIGIEPSFDLTDEEFLRTRAQGSVSYRTGKSTFGLSKYNELRTYELSGNELSSEGADASWQRHFASRTSSLISLQGQRFEVLNSPDKRQSMIARLALTRSLSPKANARLEFRHRKADTVNTNQEYVENRISAHLNMTF